MSQLPQTRISLGEARDIVKTDCPDMSCMEVEKWIEREWRLGALPLYDHVGKAIRPDEGQRQELDFETSKVRSQGLRLTICDSDGEPSDPIEIIGNVSDVRVDRQQLHALLGAVKSTTGAREAGPRRAGALPRGGKMKEIFLALKDGELFEKSMTKKEIYSLIIKELFGSEEPPRGYSYDSFIRHVGGDIDTWQAE